MARIVQKFGGTSVADMARIKAVAATVKRELDDGNEVAVVLSAQATDVSVNKATGPLYAVADTPQAMVTLGEDALRGYIRTIGLFNTKAKNVIKLSQMLIDEHDGEVRCGGRQAGAVEQAVDRAPDGLDGGVDLVGVRQVAQGGFVDGAAARLDVEPVDLGPEGGQDRRSR